MTLRSLRSLRFNHSNATGIDIKESVRDMGALIPGFYENQRFSNEKYMKKPSFSNRREQVIKS
ncbi:hypothetical protein QUB28_28090 [Microcoleus sp. B4-C3]|uniref:hypothetical protein n=1 Tax=Microcoleus sp. B4-C2 TaxID=2818661 RepID=UPI002FD196A0